MSHATRILISAAPSMANYTEPVMMLRMEDPETGVQSTYDAATADIPKILECEETYRVKINRYGSIVGMKMI